MARKKTINGNITEKDQQEVIAKKLAKKIHHFHVGDVVSFEIELSPRGDRQIATSIVYMFNDALSNLINIARDNNEFTGYLKLVGEDYFVKETGSYLFFPVNFSTWEIRPPEDVLNEPVTFILENIDNPEKVTARLKNQYFIPEFHKAEQVYRGKVPTPARVYNVTPHGIFINLFGGKIKAKIPITKEISMISDQPLVIGDRIDVLITYLSPKKIVVEKV